jgi:hypothetical protein
MKRADLLGALKFAGYHGDSAAWTRLTIENRISITAAGQAYARGIEARKAGMACGCSDCAAAKTAA